MAMLVMGVVLLVNQQMNVGQFVAAEIVIITIINSVEKLIASLDKVYDALTSIQKLSKVLDSEIEQFGSLALANEHKGVSIKFDNVNFGYNDITNQADLVLSNISFDINPGQFVCITGASGSGKSSILRLLTGAFKNFNGSILLEHVPIANYNLQSLRNQTGVLLSQQDIFQGTLLENITMTNKHTSLEEITQLAEKIGLIEFIQSNKDGYDTILDPLGKRLSKKIKQDILLLRVLIGKHRLLLLEEPFNHLEKMQKDAVINFLKNEKNATIIITSEDESTIKECDVILKLQNGKLVNTSINHNTIS